MPSLGGKTVAILESRLGGELAQLIANCGGVAYHAPALREEPVADEGKIASLLDALRKTPADVVVLQTGVGTRALYAGVEELGRLPEWERALERALVVARGPKPTAALRERGARIDVRVAEPYTTAVLLEALAAHDLRGKVVVVQRYGDANARLVEALHSRGAVVHEVEVYRWALPSDLAPLEGLLHDLPTGRIHALAATSQAQVRHLFLVAERLGLASSLPETLRQHTVVVAVGPVAASAFQSYGVAVDVQPQHPKMGAMILDLARYFEQQQRESLSPTSSTSH